MSTSKRIISLLLVMLLLVGAFAPAAQAAPAEETATVNTDTVTIEGTNGFGDLLSQEITESQEEAEAATEEFTGGYTVTDLQIENGVATVTYDSMEEATLVVALYTEDGMQLLTSATATVTPDATEATVTFEGEMPEYFMASAYLLDGYDLSPLCAAYDTPMYTREMQELLASTVEDYAPEKVLNLDDDNTTNFAVYAESTIVIEPVEGKNTVTSIDDENAVYVIKNADTQITSLTLGSVFVYPYAENEILIVKVTSISLDGTTATIIGAELEMNDVFSYVKIESTADAGNAVVHEETGDDCVTYNGVQYNDAEMNGQESPLQPDAWEDDITIPMPSLEFGIEETFEDAKGNKIAISGGMKLEADISLQYYIALFSQYVKFQIDTTAGLNFTVAGTVELFEFDLPEIDFDLVPQLVSVGSKPKVEVSFNGEIGWEGNVHFTVGFAIGHNVPKQDLCTGPWVESKTNLKVGFAVKIDLQPNLSAKTTDFLELISARVICPAGFEVTAEQNGQSAVDAYGNQGSSIHTCLNCLKFELFGCVELGAEIVFLDKVKLVNKGDGLSITIPFKTKAKVPILSAYYSATYDDFGFGSCPYESYRLTIEVLDSAEQPVKDTPVYTKKESWGKTNKYGVLATYVPEGTYELYTIVEDEELTATIQVDGPDYLKISPNNVVSNSNPGSGSTGENDGPSDDWWNGIDFGDISDGSSKIESGTCGENIQWCLYENGIMAITGNGRMDDYSSSSKIPWYHLRSDIARVFVEYGVSNICAYAFRDCKNLSEISIPGSVTEIGNNAFYGCMALQEVVIPDSVNTIGSSAFSGCENLRYAVIGASITHIPQSLFSGCEQLKEIIIPASVTEVGKYAFNDCDGLQTVHYGGTKRVWNKMVVRRAETDHNESLLNAKVFFGTVDEVEFDGGIGSAEDPYLVSTAQQLRVVHEDLEAHYLQTADIDLAGLEWEPIGYIIHDKTSQTEDDARPFLGVFNGQQFKISNMRITRISNEHRATGLFGYNHGTVKNVVLEDGVIDITITEDNIDDVMMGSGYYTYPCIGAIAGHNRGTVKSCRNSGNIKVAVSYDSLVFVGGIVGNGACQDSLNAANIYAYGDDGNMGSRLTLYVGGVVGFPGAIHREIIRCVNTGNIIGSIDQYTASNTLVCGGITGEDGSLVNCVNYGQITGTINSNKQNIRHCCVGGLSGHSSAGDGSYSDVVSCVNFGDVFAYSSYEKTSCNAGGLFGYYEGEASNCYNIASTIYADLWLAYDDEYECYVGRILGDGNGKIDQCYSIDNTVLGAGEPKYPEGQGISMCEDDIYAAIQDILTTLNLSLDGENQAADKSKENRSSMHGLSQMSEKCEDVITPDAIFGGEYGAEFTESHILKTAYFSDLVPNEQYVLLAMASIEVEDPLAPDNLLFIEQETALENGTLSLRYVQRTPHDISYVMVCGASHKNLNDAEITFPEMVADGELQVVNPVVVYDGVTLTEGRDYVIVGKVDFTEAGEYTCYIRGIRNYTGLVECAYRVTEKVTENPFGDVSEGSFYYESVMWAVENGITTGTSATEFSPYESCLRSQVVTFLWRAAGKPAATSTHNPFVDVKPGDYYYDAVLWAVEKGITTGIDSTRFDPNGVCNRSQVVTFLYRAFEKPPVENAANPFTDVPAAEWYATPVLWAVQEGITNGLSATKFGPNEVCNRSQVVTFLYRAYN